MILHCHVPPPQWLREYSDKWTGGGLSVCGPSMICPSLQPMQMHVDMTSLQVRKDALWATLLLGANRGGIQQYALYLAQALGYKFIVCGTGFNCLDCTLQYIKPAYNYKGLCSL